MGGHVLLECVQSNLFSHSNGPLCRCLQDLVTYRSSRLQKVLALHNLPEIQPAGASVSNVSSRHGIDGGVVRRCTQKARRVERGEGDDLGDSYWAHVCIDHIFGLNFVSYISGHWY